MLATILIKLYFSRHLFKNTPISNFMKIRQMTTEMFHAEGQTDMKSLSAIFRTRLKKGLLFAVPHRVHGRFWHKTRYISVSFMQSIVYSPSTKHHIHPSSNSGEEIRRNTQKSNTKGDIEEFDTFNCKLQKSNHNRDLLHGTRKARKYCNRGTPNRRPRRNGEKSVTT
jgi:hypothetical protein